MTYEGWRSLLAAVASLAGEPDVRAVVLCGAGRAFCAGADLEDLETVSDRRAYVRLATEALEAFEALPMPTVAAVHGEAFGAGLELTLLSDIVVADTSARFATPETGAGLLPAVALARGASSLPLHWLKYLVFTGDVLDAAEAQRVGLVTKLVPLREHEAVAEAIARLIAERAPLAVRAVKDLLMNHAGNGWARALEKNVELQDTADAAEGLAAFTERRAPHFTGR
jgi:enoyl-CoA hydratase/carnithine racemase